LLWHYEIDKLKNNFYTYKVVTMCDKNIYSILDEDIIPLSPKKTRVVLSNYTKPVYTRYSTKPCFFVLKKNGRQEYGICTRADCRYAHSKQELRVPTCTFGDKCTRTRDECLYFHPNETLEKFYQRVGKQEPDLPDSSERSYQPVQESNSVITIKVPKELAGKALELALKHGRNFRLEMY
jgi:hypothetical protein